MAATVPRTPLQLYRSPRNASSSYRAPVVCVLKTASLERGGSGGVESGSQESYHAPSLLRKPPAVKIPRSDYDDMIDKEAEEKEHDVSDDEWADWEDRILEETVPLVGFVRTLLHSGKYKIGDRLSPEYQTIILERLLPYHPAYDAKIGCGVESITVGFHPEFKGTRCLFIVRKDGELVDFSYWKCIKGLIRKKYPRFADAFILRHFRRRRRNTEFKKN
ncbi:hypothetical protein TIFTF001_002695 [Ficus carica]|uniref:Protein DCL, chloroplastic n=1 Tax=Ficus carica TaxID=3494 RepID=A0AA88D8G1_FICCA|nr:hypothetical protein TIFTF001_002695 [Ficus carica]